MKVRLRNPARIVDLHGPRYVQDMLAELGLIPEAVLVIRGDELLMVDERLRDADEIEIRPVISGGAR